MNLKNIDKLEVYYKNELVGHLIDNGNLTHSFTYCDEWLNNGFSISPFKLPLEPRVFVCNDYLIQSMFGVFYDSLPDSWGNKLIDSYLSNKGINSSNVTMLQRLALLDKYSLGALSYKPSLKDNFELSDSDEYDEIYNGIEKFLKNDSDIDFDLYHYGSSTGGSRPKINKFINGDLYIVKFPSHLDPLDIGESEYKLNLLAKECGLNVPDYLLLPSKKTKGYFATKRFDYDRGNKKHVISLAGLFDLNPSLSQIHYLGFLQTVRALCPEDLIEAVKRMIFNYLIGNKDDHPRNFSFIYDEESKSYRLSPFYDITSTPNIKEHMMQVNDKDEPELEDFVIEASKVGVDKKIVVEIYGILSNKVKNFNK